MAQTLNQVPPNLEVWVYGKQTYLVRLIPDTEPPIPIVWKVDPTELAALGVQGADRTFASRGDFWSTGALLQGTSRELINTTVDPWESIKSNFATEAKVKPWLADPEILALWTASAYEGRTITEAELQGTEWWRTHTEAERQWISLNASDPQTANQFVGDQRTRVADLLAKAGIDNATTDLINTVADSWTTGQWSEAYALNQVRLLADPYLTGDLDPLLKGFQPGLDSTQAGTDAVRQLVNTWLGPAYAAQWSEDNIGSWASQLRENPDARTKLTEVLRGQRLALFPEYDNPNLTYEDIAAPWRNVWTQEWGSIADESDPLFARIVRANDITAAQQLLRTEGLAQNNTTVSQRLLSDLNGAFGGQIRRPDAAIV